MKAVKRLFIFLLIIVALAFVLSREKVVQVGDAKIRVEIADSPDEIERGLSGRASIDADAGMLFVFSEPTVPQFWMKDMQFAIDIIWLDENKKIIGIERNVTPDTYPNTFSPPSPVWYVLETNPGLVSF